ncbi:heme ABC transporter permease [Aestuariirhabdus litorea]|uniref:Heme exporter protein C n=1 Tax=Aestuariirhabdus litorea TaxID=2528527 RepID=A0A3P3VNS9_9GAMM|nr:heme ABC transporter permease [Aestuariirhabdus litorea]RRJ84412.1 heme ABC transporter permease [Aestuariirhabdus litorea]RWW97636.1 heme ABC transporter permease [Endozoicomonadaceae bacterium GTF-13]
MNWTWFHKMGSPKWFYDITDKWMFWLGLASAVLLAVAMVWGLAFAPADYQQGNSYRIIFVHVPSAFLAQACYIMMAVAGAIGLIWKMKLADMAAKVSAPIGASFTILALLTGAIWGKPTWGTWWVWDARLTSMLLLLFLYFGYMALQSAFDNEATASKASSILALVGLVNIPIIKYSVEWWNTLHQPATLTLTERPAMATEMLIPLLLSIAAFYCFFTLVFLMRLRTEVLIRENRTNWVKKIVQPDV